MSNPTAQQKFDTFEHCPHCNAEFLTSSARDDHVQDCPERADPEPEPAQEPEGNRPEPIDPGTDNGNVKKLPVNRDYDWNRHVPSNVPEYRESGTELQRIMADIENRFDSGQTPRYLISGDTGAGKTHLAQSIAESRESPLFTIQGKYSMDESDLLGSPVLVNGETIWTDGTLTKALLASREREVVLLVDELNRARPESKGVLFSALDDRCRVELDARAGEVVEGDPSNLIVIGTINEGTEYTVQELDKAEKRRFGRKFEVEHLGLNHADKEAEVITTRTPASKPVAKRLVTIANQLRDDADNPESVLDTGVPTSSLLDWSRTAFAYANAGIDNPIVESARDTVVRPIYGNDRIRQEAMETVKDYADNAPYGEQEFKQWREDPDRYSDKICNDCGREFASKRGVSLHRSQSDCGE